MDRFFEKEITLKTPSRKLFFVIFILPFFASSLEVFSARFPNSIQKTFAVSGKTALEWAKVLGLDTKGKQNLSFPLHPMEAHALSISLNSSPTEAPAFNSLAFDPEKQTLTLSGNWLDQLTGSGVSKKPRYTFGSGFIPEDLTGAASWGDVLRSLGFPRSGKTSKKHGEVLATRTSDTHWFPWTEKLPWLEVRVYQMESYEEAHKDHPWGYQVVIGVEE